MDGAMVGRAEAVVNNTEVVIINGMEPDVRPVSPGTEWRRVRASLVKPEPQANANDTESRGPEKTPTPEAPSAAPPIGADQAVTPAQPAPEKEPQLQAAPQAEPRAQPQEVPSTWVRPETSADATSPLPADAGAGSSGTPKATGSAAKAPPAASASAQREPPSDQLFTRVRSALARVVGREAAAGLPAGPSSTSGSSTGPVADNGPAAANPPDVLVATQLSAVNEASASQEAPIAAPTSPVTAVGREEQQVSAVVMTAQEAERAKLAKKQGRTEVVPQEDQGSWDPRYDLEQLVAAGSVGSAEMPVGPPRTQVTPSRQLQQAPESNPAATPPSPASTVAMAKLVVAPSPAPVARSIASAAPQAVSMPRSLSPVPATGAIPVASRPASRRAVATPGARVVRPGTALTPPTPAPAAVVAVQLGEAATVVNAAPQALQAVPSPVVSRVTATLPRSSVDRSGSRRRAPAAMDVNLSDAKRVEGLSQQPAAADLAAGAQQASRSVSPRQRERRAAPASNGAAPSSGSRTVDKSPGKQRPAAAASGSGGRNANSTPARSPGRPSSRAQGGSATANARSQQRPRSPMPQASAQSGNEAKKSAEPARSDDRWENGTEPKYSATKLRKFLQGANGGPSASRPARTPERLGKRSWA